MHSFRVLDPDKLSASATSTLCLLQLHIILLVHVSIQLLLWRLQLALRGSNRNQGYPPLRLSPLSLQVLLRDDNNLDAFYAAENVLKRKCCVGLQYERLDGADQEELSRSGTLKSTILSSTIVLLCRYRIFHVDMSCWSQSKGADLHLASCTFL
jgi:hypothetical protein